MKPRHSVVVLLSVCSFSALSQSVAHYHHNVFWGRIGIADKFSERLKWEAYYQNRTQNDPYTDKENIFKYHQNTSYTVQLYYTVLKNFRLSFTPFCYFHSIGLLPQGADNGNRGIKEFRWMLTAEHTGRLGIFDIGHRYTAEYRYRDLFTPNVYVHNYRLRYRGRIEHTLKEDAKHPVTLLLYDEVFLEFGGSVVGSPAVFNQNRLFGGFTYEPMDHVKVNIGYIYLVQERQSGKAFDYSNVLSAAVTFEGLFSSRKKENISDSQPGE